MSPSQLQMNLANDLFRKLAFTMQFAHILQNYSLLQIVCTIANSQLVVFLCQLLMFVHKNCVQQSLPAFPMY